MSNAYDVIVVGGGPQRPRRGRPTSPSTGCARSCWRRATSSAVPRSASSRSGPTTRSPRCRTSSRCCRPTLVPRPASWTGTATTSTRRARTSRRAVTGSYLAAARRPRAPARADRRSSRPRTPTRSTAGTRWLDELGAILGPMLGDIPPKVGSRRPRDLARQALLLRRAHGRSTPARPSTSPGC